MKQWKKTIAGLTACTMLLTGAMAYLPELAVNTEIMVQAAEEFTTGTYEELTYENYGDHIRITGCDKSAKVLVIPPEIEGIAVTEIGDKAFYQNSTLTSIIVSETVTTIGNHAFAESDALKEVVLHEGLQEVETNAFNGTPITEIYIPSTLQSCYHIFDGCSTLTDVTFGEGITELPDYLFYNADGITKINVPETVTVIGNHVFAESDALTEVVLHEGLQEVGTNAFDGTPITEIYIPSTLQSTYHIFDGCSTLTDVTFGEGITELPDYLFYNADGIAEINVPETVTVIGNHVFANSDALKEVVLHEGLEEVGANAFDGTPITEIYIPSTLRNTYHIFDGCSTLTDVTFGEGITELPDYLFYNADGIAEITIPETVTTIGNYVFANSDALKDAHVPASVTEIGCGVFEECPVMTDVWYAGSEEAWNSIWIAKPNTGLDNAVIHYGASTPTPVEPLMGDLDGSGDINASDAATLLTAAAAAGTGGVSSLTPEQEKAADLNKDGTFDAKDGALVLQYAAYVGTGGTQTIDGFLAERTTE